MDKAEMLAIFDYSVLFTKDSYKSQYRELCKKWHPDSGGDPEVFAKISDLYHMASSAYEAKAVIASNTIEIVTGTGLTTVKYDYLNRTDFNGGTVYTNKDFIIYSVLRTIFDDPKVEPPKFKYKNADMEKEFARYFPRKYVLIDNHVARYMRADKSKDQYLLSDIIRYNKLDARHIAWIISRLYNICSFFQYNEYVHLDLSDINILISPEFHSASIYGGWGWSCKEGSRITKLPQYTYDILPYSDIADKRAKYSMMDAQIKALGRQLFGDRYATYQQLLDLGVSESFAEFLTSSAQESIFKAFYEWDNTYLTAIFGAKKFVVLDIDDSDVYRM